MDLGLQVKCFVRRGDDLHLIREDELLILLHFMLNFYDVDYGESHANSRHKFLHNMTESAS